MTAVNAHDVTPELAEVARRINEAGWTWRLLEDADGPSGTKMGQLLKGEGRVRNDVLRKLEDVFGWPSGTGLSLVAVNTRVRRGALTAAVVRPPGQSASRGRGLRRGEDDALVNEERKMVGEAARLLAQAAEILAKVAAGGTDD